MEKEQREEKTIQKKIEPDRQQAAQTDEPKDNGKKTENAPVNKQNNSGMQPDQQQTAQTDEQKGNGRKLEQVLKEKEEQLAAKEEELEELHQRHLRLAADFDNFRRRTRNEMEENRKMAAKRLLGELLPVVDNFERALAAARASLPAKVVSGVEMIHRQLTNLLAQEGVTAIESVGKPFDPVYQEAFEQVETEESPDGTVIAELQKGYLLAGKVLRPALVRVAKNNRAGGRQAEQDSVKEDEDNE